MKLNEIAQDKNVVKTKNGSPIQRSKYGVGKSIGGNLYLHRNYVTELPTDMQQKILNAEQLIDGFKYNTLKVGLNDGRITFIDSPDFDTSPEPSVGEYVAVSPDESVKRGKSSAIWHHKWLWVKDDYRGFDVGDARERSQKYLKMDIDFSRIGNKKFWEDNYATRI